MCEPTAVLTALTVAGTAHSLNTTRRNARRQERAERRARATEREQIADQLSVETNARRQAARRERARLRALSAESGLAGITMQTLLDNVEFQAGTDVALLEQNAANQEQASASRHQSRLNAIQQPDYLGGALDAGLSIYRLRDQQGGS